VAIAFNISGGIAGFCDSLTVSTGGDYVWQSCNGKSLNGGLEQGDLDVLQPWLTDLTAFQLLFEDNPGGPDNLTRELVFNGTGSTEADEAQKQVIFDWVNGLFIRLRPQAVEAPPTPTPAGIGPDGLCPNVNRPAVIIADFHNPGNLTVMDPNSLVECNVALQQAPSGRIMTASGNIYYPAFDPDTQTITIWQLNPAGEQTPLAFTTVTMELFGPFTFALSGDGSKIAWGRTVINPDLDPPIYRYDLWTANIDGSNQVTLLAQVENSEKRFVEPIRFSPDNHELYYTLQPDGVGVSVSGRFDNIYTMPVVGGPPQLIFACPTAQNPICIGDLTPDGSALAYTQPNVGEVSVIDRNGNLLATLAAPATDYVGPAIFGPTGNLAFVSATLSPASDDTPPLPNPGYISFIGPPYSGQPRILLTNNRVVALWEWLDENRLAYGAVDEGGNVGTAVVTIDGQIIELSPTNYALAVLR
jgi:hypothetical protein